MIRKVLNLTKKKDKFCPEKKTIVGHTNRENCVLAYSYIIVSQQIMLQMT